ncbi:hypothetical protein EJB05_29157, partial [Eragrostis curvula]
MELSTFASSPSTEESQRSFKLHKSWHNRTLETIDKRVIEEKTPKNEKSERVKDPEPLHTKFLF